MAEEEVGLVALLSIHPEFAHAILEGVTSHREADHDGLELHHAVGRDPGRGRGACEDDQAEGRLVTSRPLRRRHPRFPS